MTALSSTSTSQRVRDACAFLVPRRAAALTRRVLLVSSDICAVQASLQSNTYVVSGHAETKTMAEMLPSLLSQLGNNPNGLKMLTEQLARARVGGGAGGEDEDIPDLEGADFEAASK